MNGADTQPPKSSDREGAVFFVLMSLSSGLTLARAFVLAWLLSAAAFGTYAVVMALGAFVGGLLSLGQIERGYKRFPRLFFGGHAKLALKESDRISLALGRRTLAAGVVLVLAVWIAGQPAWMAGAGATAAIAFGTALQTNYSSVQRAGGNLIWLARATLSRTVLALVLAAAGGFVWSWPGAIAGEVTGAVIGAWLSRIWAIRVIDRAPERSAEMDPEPEGKDMWLFGGFLLLAVPTYLDRSLVSSLYGNEVTGTYALLMIFVTGTLTAVGIVNQKLLPEFVRMERQGAPRRVFVATLLRWVGGLGALSLAGTAAGAVAFLFWPLDSLGAKYALDLPLFIATGLLAAAQAGQFISWPLVAHDRERDVFLAATAYLVLLGVGAVAAWLGGMDLTSLMLIMAGAKLVHLAMLAVLAFRQLPADVDRQGRAP